jgi:hypothetical protein
LIIFNYLNSHSLIFFKISLSIFPFLLLKAVADAQRIAIVRFVGQSAADEQQMGEASEEKFGRQQNGRNNNNHAAAAGGEAESSGQAHARKR